MDRTWVTLEGNEAAARIAHKLSEVIAIYPITPSTPMGELADAWSAAGQPNIWGTIPQVIEMQSEGGAAGAVTSPAIEAPGQLASHYAPGKPVRLGAQTAAADEFHIGFGPVAGNVTLSASGDLVEAAARLYACLHAAAAASQPRVAVAPVLDDGIGAAINDRLRRAAA